MKNGKHVLRPQLQFNWRSWITLCLFPQGTREASLQKTRLSVVALQVDHCAPSLLCRSANGDTFSNDDTFHSALTCAVLSSLPGSRGYCWCWDDYYTSFIHRHIGGNAYTHKTFQRYLGQFKGRRANIWGRKDWQSPIASIQRGFNSWLAECSVNHCRNFLLFNHLCTFLGIGSSIWSGLPSVYCPVFLNAGSSLNQSLLYFPPSLRPNVFSSVVAFCTMQHIYICPPIPHTFFPIQMQDPVHDRSFFAHYHHMWWRRVCFDRSFLGSRKKISAPGKTHKTPPPLFILFWTDNEV